MKKTLKNLNDLINILKDQHSNLPSNIFETLDEVKQSLMKKCVKKHCKDWKNLSHYDNNMGLWKCDGCIYCHKKKLKL